MKFLTLLCISLGLSLTACNSGSGSSSSAQVKYLPVGNYTATYSNFAPANSTTNQSSCDALQSTYNNMFTQSIVNSSGQQCNTSSTLCTKQINLNANPCMQNNSSGFYSNCSFTNNTFSAATNITVNNVNCIGTVSMQKQ